METTTRPARHRAIRLVAWLLLGAWGLMLGAVVVGALAVRNGWQPERVRAAIERLAPEVLKHEVRIGRLEGGLRDGLTLHDVSVWPVGELAAQSGTLRASRISLRVAEGASLRRRALVLPEVSIVGAVIELSRLDERGWLLTGWGPLGNPESTAPPTILPVAVLVGALSLEKTELSLTRDVTSGLENIAGRLDAGAGGLRLKDTSRIEWPIEASLRLDVSRAGWRGVDLGRGGLAARIDGPKLQVEHLELDGPVGQVLTTGDISWSGPLNRPRARSGQIHTQASNVDVNALARRDAPEDTVDWTRLNGDIDLVLSDRSLEGEPGFDLDMHSRVTPSTVLGGRIESADLSATYRTGVQRWWLHESEIELAAGRVVVTGTGVALRAERLDATADDLDVGLLPSRWRGDTAARGRAALALALHGALADPVGTLRMKATELYVEGAGPSDLTLGLGSLGAYRYRLDALDWHFAPSAGRWADTRLIARGPASLEVGSRSFAVRDLGLEWNGGSLAVDGGVRDGRLLPSRVGLQNVDLAIAARLLDLDGGLGGIVSGHADVSGAARRPDVRADLDWVEPRYQGLRADHISLRIDGDAQHRSADARMLRDGREALRLAARVPRPIEVGDPRKWLADPRTRVDIDADRFDLVWLQPLLADRSLAPSGLLDGRLTAAGSKQGPSATGELNVDAAQIVRPAANDADATPILGPVSGRLVFVDDRARTEALRYGQGQDEFSLEASLGWSGAQAEDLDFSAKVAGIGFQGRAILQVALRGDVLETSLLTFDDFDVAELGRRARLAVPIGGALTGEVVVRGPLVEPDLRTRLTWREPEVGGIRADRLVVEAKSDQRSLALGGGLEREGRRVLDAEGSLPLDRREPLMGWLAQLAAWPSDPAARLAIRADAFPLDWLGVMAPGLPIKTDGRVGGEITVRGADPALSVDGWLDVDQGVFALATQNASVGPLSGTIHFESQRARFDRLLVSASRGGAVLAGSVQWAPEGIDSVSLRADFDEYRFDQLGMFRSNLDGSLLASGPLDALAISGTLELGDIRVAFPSREDPVLKEIRVLGLPEQTRSASILEGEAEIAGIETQSTVDVSLVLPRGTWVRGIGLDAEIIGKIDVTKSAGGELRYLGRIQVEHGRYKLQGKRFELDSGVAVFTGGRSPVPDVDIQAHRQASRDVEVFAHVSGPADAPTLELTSDPAMDVAEIISYLFFGRSATVGNREGQGVGVSAASMAGSMLIDSVAPELRETLRIDEISVTSGDDDEAPAVEIETQITPDVYLRLSQSLGASADEAVEVRWRFWRGFNLQSRVSRSGISAIDLLWEFDYWGLDRYGLDGFTSPPPPYRAEPRPEPTPDAEPCRPPLVCTPS